MAKLVIRSTFGNLLVEFNSSFVTRVSWISDDTLLHPGEESGSIITLIKEEFLGYFEGKVKKFSIPCSFSGTPFQQKVWKALLSIPYGETVSYSTLSEMAGFDPSHARAVGIACAKNPLPLIIPCHRVIHKDGSIGNYSAPGGSLLKRRLIEFEKSNLLRGSTL